MTNEDITIDELLEFGKISLRTANCCRSVGLRTVADIREYAAHCSFDNIRGCGRKSQQEISELLQSRDSLVDYSASSNQSDSAPDLFSYPASQDFSLIPANLLAPFNKIFDDTIAETFGENRATYLDLYPSIDNLLNDTYRDSMSMFVIPDNLDYDTVLDIWECTNLIFTRIEAAAHPVNPSLAGHFAIRTSCYRNKIDFRKYLLAKKFMSDARRQLVDREYRRLFDTMSPRSRNSLINSQISEEWLMEMILTSTLLNSSIRNCGRKSVEEIASVYSKFPRIVVDIMRMSDIEINARMLIEEYPFLTRDELAFAIDFELRNGHTPLLYLVYCYLRSEQRRLTSAPTAAQIHCAYYGIGCEVVDRQTLAEMHRLSAERIRQILVGYRLPDDFMAKINNISRAAYPELRYEGAFADANLLYSRVAADELRDFNPAGPLSFAGVLMLLGNYLVVQRRGSMIFVVDKAISARLDFQRALSALEVHCSHRHECDEPLDVEAWCHNYLPEGAEPSQVAIDCFKEMILSYLPVKDVDGQIYVCRNYVRPAREAYAIIQEHGSPMTLDQLYAEFKRRFPDHKFDDPECLRCHLNQANGFRAIGKQSTYSLDIWDYNTDSNTELIYKILSESDVPLHSSEIVRRLADYGRESTSMLVVNFIYMDHKRGFLRFRNSYFGIPGKEYPEQFRAVSPDELRVKTFDERIDDLINFIGEHHHRPRSNDDPVESSLYRWIENVHNRKVNLTDEQLQRFYETINRHSEDFITWSEYEFSQQCERLIKYAEENLRLPHRNLDTHLYRWYHRALLDYNANSLTDFRRKCFRTALDRLAALGLKSSTLPGLFPDDQAPE